MAGRGILQHFRKKIDPKAKKRIKMPKGYLSACAEDHGLCPWMNAQNVAESFRYRSIDAPADFAVGG
jgi:hypothetical protein